MEKSQIIHLQTKTEQATTPRHKQAKITSKSQLFITKQVGSLAVQSAMPAITYFPHIGSHWPMHEFLKQTHDFSNKMILFSYYIHIFIYIYLLYIFLIVFIIFNERSLDHSFRIYCIISCCSKKACAFSGQSALFVDRILGCRKSRRDTESPLQ